MSNYNILQKEIEQIYRINNVISMLYWDITVNIPKKSLDNRTSEITLLDNIARDKLKSPVVQELIDKTSMEINELDHWQVANLREIKRQILDATCIGDDLNNRYIETSAKCESVWRDAKKDNDYQKLLPYLQEVLTCARDVGKNRAEAFGFNTYDALIDMYDPGNNARDIKKLFDKLKQEIPPLIQEITEKQKGQEIPPLDPMPIEQQKAIGIEIMKAMEFDFARGRLDESIHPCLSSVNSDDARITTRYYENNFLSGLLGIIHETGHALYEQHLPAAYARQPVGSAKGMAIHESQSLFMEMQVGRSREFCEFLSKLLHDKFNIKGEQYFGDNLYKRANRVTPSFIRVEADEVTYPMHVILRFELEELLMSGDLALKDVPQIWSDKMHQYLGIRPETNSQGCMQDIHWHQGSFGYFPAYLKGSIIASQLMHKLKATNPNTKAEITNGNFSNINAFLNEKIRGHGSLKSTAKLVEDAVGIDNTDPKIFTNYLREKYI